MKRVECHCHCHNWLVQFGRVTRRTGPSASSPLHLVTTTCLTMEPLQVRPPPGDKHLETLLPVVDTGTSSGKTTSR